MSSKYSRSGQPESGEHKADTLIELMRELNDNFRWLREYVEEMEIGEAVGEIADNTGALVQVFTKVGKLEGGVGVVNALIQGIKNHVKEGEKT